jgi:plastocyanin
VAAAALALAASCGGRKEAATSSPPPDAKRVDPATAGTVSGRVLFKGTIPSTTPITPGTDRVCTDENPGGIASEDYVIAEGGLENVLVYVKDEMKGYAFDIPAEAVKLDQRGCRFVPHVLGVRAGQPLTITNSDDAPHNVHALPAANAAFNKSQALKNMADTKVFDTPEVMIPFKCDIHPWMQAYVGVIQHPYFMVTHDGGRFELKDLPPGTYTIQAWHEKLGTNAQQVTIGPKESKELTFTFQ